ncbi:MAG: DinB family protein [Candidatus Promineofilum sp.]|nr:DinB family protein [Promineifilum sp.]
MNSLIETEFPLHEAQRLRYDLLRVLTDGDLAYKLPGDNPTLGELCREMGEVEHDYIQSFKTFKHEWSYRAPEPEVAGSVARLEAWYRALDDEFEAVVRGFSEEELHQRQIDRGHGFTPSLFVQFQIYREALLIFFAKASVYLKALQREVSDEWRIGIG